MNDITERIARIEDCIRWIEHQMRLHQDHMSGYLANIKGELEAMKSDLTDKKNGHTHEPANTANGHAHP